jgi:hypothetical protein
VFTIAYADAAHAKLGSLTLYKHEKPGELPPDTSADPANPPKPEVDYYIMTEKTRVPGLVRKDTAQRAENDVAVVFGEKPPNDIPVAPPKAPPAHPGMGPHGGPPGGHPGMPGHPGAPGAPGIPGTGPANMGPPGSVPPALAPPTPAPAHPAPSPSPSPAH